MLIYDEGFDIVTQATSIDWPKPTNWNNMSTPLLGSTKLLLEQCTQRVTRVNTNHSTAPVHVISLLQSLP